MTRSGRWFPCSRARCPRARRRPRRRPGRGGGRDPVVARDGRAAGWVKDLADGFNKSQQEYKVNAVYKGNYTETMTGAIGVPRKQQPPHRPGLRGRDGDDDGREGRRQAGLRADGGRRREVRPEGHLPAVTGYYTTADGRMLSLPLNSSTPVLYYNKDAFKKAGLDPNKPPKTWPEMGEYGKKIQAAGYPCGFSSQWQQWILLENYSAWHNVPIATKQNGFGGLDAELQLNTPLHVRIIDQLAQWQKTKTFDYGGRKGDANPKFATGECGCSSRLRRTTRTSSRPRGQGSSASA